MSAAARGAGIDLLRARVALRDRSLSDVLDLALRFVVAHGRTYAWVALGAVAPLLAIALLAGALMGWTAAWLVALPLALVADVPFTLLASRLVFEDDVSARAVLVAALRSAPRLVFARLLVATLVLFGLSVFLVPGLWIATILLFVGEAMLLERAPLGQAFGRAQRLASNATSDALLGLLVLGVVPIASVALADVAGRAILGELLQLRPPPSLWTAGGGALATAGLFAQVPYRATARFFLYLNIRTRAEGWDIQTRFAALAARAEVRLKEGA